MIYKFVLDAILHHVVMSWIICYNKGMKYEINKSENPNWLNKVPWYNTSIFSRLHGNMFGYFITHAINDRYNTMCSLVAHDKKHPAHENE